jgi:hypothetical protein
MAFGWFFLHEQPPVMMFVIAGIGWASAALIYGHPLPPSGIGVICAGGTILSITAASLLEISGLSDHPCRTAAAVAALVIVIAVAWIFGGQATLRASFAKGASQ